MLGISCKKAWDPSCLGKLSEMVTEYLNINAFFDYDINFERDDIAPHARSSTSTLPSLIEELELSQSQFVAIPPEVLRVYSRFRPTPLFRAFNFEKAIGSKSEIYIKDESKTPTGNHKINSSLFDCILV